MEQPASIWPAFVLHEIIISYSYAKYKHIIPDYELKSPDPYVHRS